MVSLSVLADKPEIDFIIAPAENVVTINLEFF